MKTFKRIYLIGGICLAYLAIMYLTFNAVAKVPRTSNPVTAKKIVLLTFFANAGIFAGSCYLIYKLTIPTEKK